MGAGDEAFWWKKKLADFLGNFKPQIYPHSDTAMKSSEINDAMRIDFRRCCGLVLAASLLSSVVVQAQPYHSDVILGSEQTLQVEGNALIKQYGSGLGGDLTVVGDASFAVGGISLTGLPSGVTGTFYGTHKVGTVLNTAEYRFSKTGDNTSGDFIVPLGTIGDGMIDLDVVTGPADVDSGGAHFKLMAKRHGTQGPLVAVSHSAYAGGIGIQLYSFNAHGYTHLYLKFDATSNNPTEVHEHTAIVKISTLNTLQPFSRDVAFSQTAPVRVDNSYDSAGVLGGQTTQSINTDKIALNGDVTIASGKSLKIGTSDVLTTSFAPVNSPEWKTAFVPRGTVSNGGNLGLGGSSASAENAVALGMQTEATGLASTSMGRWTYATGDYSMTAGDTTWADGHASFAIGTYTAATGQTSLAAGSMTEASGFASTAFGMNTVASGMASLAAGTGTAEGNVTVAAGNVVRAKAACSAVFGSSNIPDEGSPATWVETDRIFTIGNGLLPVQSNALTILKNGETTVTNKAWKGNQNGSPAKALENPSATTTDSEGQALVVEGHTRLKGKVIIEVPQGDVSMGIYGVP
jgi:hypothetical protein